MSCRELSNSIWLTTTSMAHTAASHHVPDASCHGVAAASCVGGTGGSCEDSTGREPTCLHKLKRSTPGLAPSIHPRVYSGPVWLTHILVCLSCGESSTAVRWPWSRASIIRFALMTRDCDFDAQVWFRLSGDNLHAHLGLFFPARHEHAGVLSVTTSSAACVAGECHCSSKFVWPETVP